MFEPLQPSVDLTVALALLRRLRTGEGRTGRHNRDDAAFGAFESYVELTSAVWTDRAAQQFLVETHSSQWSLNEDLAFLLSPRHFAAAIATGKVGDVEMWEVAGGLSLLGYFEWLAVLVRDTEHRPDLRDGIIGHARWSHSAGVLKSRFDQWATHMAEWNESGQDPEGTRAWKQYVRDVLDPLAAHQTRLEVRSLERQHYASVEDRHAGGGAPGQAGQADHEDAAADRPRGVDAAHGHAR